MQVSQRFVIYFISLILVCTLSVYANESHKELTSNKPLEQHFLNFPPYWVNNSEGGYSGVHYRLAKVLYNHAGLDVTFINTPYQRMQFQVQQGKVAFINYGETKGVNTEDILHICVPPTDITLKVYYLDESLSEIVNVEDFSGKKLIIMHGLPLGNYEEIKHDPTISFMRPITVDAAINGLKAGRGDYFITFGNLMVKAEQKYFKQGRYNLKSYPLYSLLGYPVVTPKSYSGGKELCEKIKSSYHQLVSEGVIDAKHKVLVSDLH